MGIGSRHAQSDIIMMCAKDIVGVQQRTYSSEAEKRTTIDRKEFDSYSSTFFPTVIAVSYTHLTLPTKA